MNSQQDRVSKMECGRDVGCCRRLGRGSAEMVPPPAVGSLLAWLFSIHYTTRTVRMSRVKIGAPAAPVLG